MQVRRGARDHQQRRIAPQLVPRRSVAHRDHLVQHDLAGWIQQEETLDVHAAPVRAEDGGEVARGTAPVIRVRGVAAELDGCGAHGAPDASLLQPRIEIRAGDDAPPHRVAHWTRGEIGVRLDGDRSAGRAARGGAGGGEEQWDGAHGVVTRGRGGYSSSAWRRMRTVLLTRAVFGWSWGGGRAQVCWCGGGELVPGRVHYLTHQWSSSRRAAVC